MSLVEWIALNFTDKWELFLLIFGGFHIGFYWQLKRLNRKMEY